MDTEANCLIGRLREIDTMLTNSTRPVVKKIGDVEIIQTEHIYTADTIIKATDEKSRIVDSLYKKKNLISDDEMSKYYLSSSHLFTPKITIKEQSYGE